MKKQTPINNRKKSLLLSSTSDALFLLPTITQPNKNLQLKYCYKLLQKPKIKSNRTGLLDLEKHFAFYGAYHSNHINVIIHTLLVWPNVFATLLFLYITPQILVLSQLGFFESLTFNGVLRLDVGFIFTVIYAVFYVCLDKKSGVLAALLCFSCWIGSSFLASRLGHSLTLKVGVASQLLCWTGQFLGHGVFEKRAPALLDNLVQAFVMGPFFVLLEVLHSVFGYEPYPGFKARVESKISIEIKEWRVKKQTKIT